MNNSKQTRDLLLRSAQLDVDSIVAELRALRLASLESRNRHDRPPRLPSRRILASVAEGLSAAMFPNRLGSSELADEGIDHYVGHTLNMTLRELMVQIQNELHYNSGLEMLSDEDRAQSIAITQSFAKRLPQIRMLLESDIKAAYEGDPAAMTISELIVSALALLFVIDPAVGLYPIVIVPLLTLVPRVIAPDLEPTLM